MTIDVWTLQQTEKDLIADYFRAKSERADLEPILADVGENTRLMVAAIATRPQVGRPAAGRPDLRA